MSRVAVFLRAINVGDRRTTNATLCDILRADGFEEVAAFQAAGNLIVEVGDARPDVVEAELEGLLADGLGFLAETFVRTADDLARILKKRPFTAEALDAATGTPQVGLLRSHSTPETKQAVRELATEADLLALIGRELHWLPMEGVGRSRLDMAAVADALGPMTVRTRGTIERMAEKVRS